MIIKRWNGTAFDELHPKTVIGNLYASDASTQLFDGNSKLKVDYLPDIAFGGMKFVGTALTGNLPGLINGTVGVVASQTLDGLTGYVWGTTGYTNFGQRYVGHYWVATSQLTIVPDVPAETDSAMYDDGVADAGVVEAGDWLIITAYDNVNNRFKFRVVNNTYAAATATAPGVVKLGSATSQAVAAEAVSATSGRTYAIQSNGEGQLVVNVPWVDTNTTYSTATNSTLGLIKVSATANSVALNSVTTTASRQYAVQVDASGVASVNVPWTDTNTTYSAATNSVLGLIKLAQAAADATLETASTTAGRFYPVNLKTDGTAYVNVPWVDTNTTYSKATSSALGLVSLGSDTVQTVAANAVSTTASRSYAVQLNASNQMVVNVPWTDTNTTYTASDGLTMNGTDVEMVYPFYAQADAPTSIKTGSIWLDI